MGLNSNSTSSKKYYFGHIKKRKKRKKKIFEGFCHSVFFDEESHRK
jgi:hypothetical protein